MVKSASRVSRVLMTGPLAPFADAYALELEQRGYTPLTSVVQLRQVARLSSWLEVRGLGVAELTGERVEEFLAFQRATAMVSTGLPEMVRRFRERYPDVDVQLKEMTPAMQVESLLRERVDVGFVRGPIHEPALETQTVLEESLVAALPSGHRLGRHKRLRLAMLADEPFVLQARSFGPGSHDQILAVCRSAGFSPRVVQEGSQAEVASLVASGAGVAIVPASLRAIRRAGVLYRPLHERPMTQLDVVWRKGSALPVLNAFLAEVQQIGVRTIRPNAPRAVPG